MKGWSYLPNVTSFTHKTPQIGAWTTSTNFWLGCCWCCGQQNFFSVLEPAKENTTKSSYYISWQILSGRFGRNSARR